MSPIVLTPDEHAILHRPLVDGLDEPVALPRVGGDWIDAPSLQVLARLDQLQHALPLDLYPSALALLLRPLDPDEADTAYDRLREWLTMATSRIQTQWATALGATGQQLLHANLLPAPNAWEIEQGLSCLLLQQVISQHPGGWTAVVQDWAAALATLPLPPGVAYDGVTAEPAMQYGDSGWHSALEVHLTPTLRVSAALSRLAAQPLQGDDEADPTQQFFTRLSDLRHTLHRISERLLLHHPAVATAPVAALLLERTVRLPETQWSDADEGHDEATVR